MKNQFPAIIRFASMSAFILLACVSSPTARSNTLTWDPTGAPTSPVGGNGTWNTSASQWSDGSSDLVWGTSTTNPDIAVFASSSPAAVYTATLNTDVYAGGLSVTSSQNVVLQGTGSVTLTGSAPLIAVTGAQLSLNAVIKGTVGFEKTGSGILRIGVGGGGTYTGITKITTGQITNDIDNGLSASASLVMANSSFLSLVGKNQSVAGLTGTSNTTVRSTSGTSTFTVTAGSGTFAGTLSDGSAAVRLNFINSGGSLTLSGTNAYRGTTEISGGSLILGSNLVGTSSVTVSGGTLTSSVANVNLGLGGTSMSSGAITPRGVGTAGTFTLAANQAFATNGGTLNFDVGTAFDQIIGAGTGTFSIGSGTTLALTLGTGFSYGNTYTLFSSFAGGTVASSGFTISGYDTVNYTAALSTTGILSFTPSAVPEPSTYAALAGAAVLGFVVLRRRRSTCL